MTTNQKTATATATGEQTPFTVLELEASYSDFALSAGLAHDASKPEILASMAQNKTTIGRLLDLFGAKTPEEAIGKLTAERSTHNDLVKAVVGSDEKDPKNLTTEKALEKLGLERKAQERKDAEGLIAAAKAGGKTVGEGTLAMFEQYGMGALKAHIAALVPHAALTTESPKQPVQIPDATSATAPTAKTAIAVTLTADEEVFITKHNLDRDSFIARRAEELKAVEFAKS